MFLLGFYALFNVIILMIYFPDMSSNSITGCYGSDSSIHQSYDGSSNPDNPINRITELCAQQVNKREGALIM